MTRLRNAPNTLGLADKLEILVVCRFHDILFPSLAEAFPLVVAATLAPPPSLVLRLVVVAYYETVEAVLVVLVLR